MIQFHNASYRDDHYRKTPIPLEISADGEAEIRPSGEIFRRGIDPENALVSTRDDENRIIPDGNYSDKKFISSNRVKDNGDVVDEDEDDEVGSMDNTVGGGSWRSANTPNPSRINDSSGPQTPITGIPKADHEKYGRLGLLSANDSPNAHRPKAQTMWSAFRSDKPEASTSNNASGTNDGSSSRPEGSKRKSRVGSTTEEDGPRNALEGNEVANTQQEQLGESVGQKKWAVLRSKLLRNQTAPNQHSSPAVVPVTSELLAGQLPVMIMKTWLGRDEAGNRAVPVLLGNLRFRVGDSAGIGESKEQDDSPPEKGKEKDKGGKTGREVFRIECEYGDGAVKWVIYRELRDFVSLHGHYRADNLKERASHIRSGKKVEVPEFPRISE